MSELTPEQVAAVQQQLAQYGQRAQEMVGELVAACQANDYHRGGELCREMYEKPDLLMLVVGILTSTVVRNYHGPMVDPSQLNMPEDYKPEAWQVAVVDQMQAAAEQRDINVFASLAVDAELRAMREDVRDLRARGEDMPDVEQLMRAFMVMDQPTVTAVAAEMMRRLLMQEVEGVSGGP